jgi:hypothetical protein
MPSPERLKISGRTSKLGPFFYPALAGDSAVPCYARPAPYEMACPGCWNGRVVVDKYQWWPALGVEGGGGQSPFI